MGKKRGRKGKGRKKIEEEKKENDDLYLESHKVP